MHWQDEDHDVISGVDVPVFDGQKIDLPVCDGSERGTAAVGDDLAGDLPSRPPRFSPLVADKNAEFVGPSAGAVDLATRGILSRTRYPGRVDG